MSIPLLFREEDEYEDITEEVSLVMGVQKDFENLAKDFTASMIRAGVNPTAPAVLQLKKTIELDEKFERGLRELDEVAQDGKDDTWSNKKDTASTTGGSSVEIWESSTTASSIVKLSIQDIPHFTQAREWFRKNWAQIPNFTDEMFWYQELDSRLVNILVALSTLAMKWRADQVEFIATSFFLSLQSSPFPTHLLEGLVLMGRCACDPDDGIYDSCKTCAKTICKNCSKCYIKHCDLIDDSTPLTDRPHPRDSLLARRVLSFCGLDGCCPEDYVNPTARICECSEHFVDPTHAENCTHGHFCKECFVKLSFNLVKSNTEKVLAPCTTFATRSLVQAEFLMHDDTLDKREVLDFNEKQEVFNEYTCFCGKNRVDHGIPKYCMFCKKRCPAVVINSYPESVISNGGYEGHAGWSATATDPGHLGWHNGTGCYFLKKTGFFACKIEQGGELSEVPGLDNWC